MFAVCVTLHLHTGCAEAFLPLVTVNAEISVRDEPGCHQFDVLTKPDDPDTVFLYELYADKAAFDSHLASAHFKTFDAATAVMIAAKDIQSWHRVAP